MPARPISRHRLSRRYQVYGLAISLFAHGCLLAGLLVVSVEPWMWLPPGGWETPCIEATFGSAEEPGWPSNSVPSTVRILPAPPLQTLEASALSDPSQLPGEAVREKLDEVLSQSKGRSAEENLHQLEQMSERLSTVASAGSVGQLAGTFHRWVGTKPRAEQPVEKPAAGEFDFETAQFHDVKRYAKDPSGWRYVAVLLDAEGRTLEVEMDESDGERVYVTLERIKANPLLEQVYRQIAMPLLDQMLGGIKQAATAGRQLQRAAKQQQEEGLRTLDDSQNAIPARTSSVLPKG
jgi:hypothetical protein